jgi:hypothetical protein
MRALAAAAAMAALIIEPENLLRMMISFSLAACSCNGIPEPRAGADAAFFGVHP